MNSSNKIIPITYRKYYIQGSAKVIFLTVVATLAFIAGAVVLGKKELKAFLLAESTPGIIVSETPKYLALEKFVISVESDTVIYYMMLEISLATSSDKKLAELNHYLPVIRNAFVKNLSHRDFEAMRGYLKNLTLLQTELHSSVKEVLVKYDIADVIDDVLITKLVIQ